MSKPSDERGASRGELHRADAVVNAFRARIRTDLRTHVAKGGALPASVVTTLEAELERVALSTAAGLVQDQ